MKFKFYDILSHLLPGFLIYLAYLELVEEKFDKDFVVPATAIAFIIGYFVNTLSSWFEGFYYWTWGGKPSDKLLEGKGIWKINFYFSNEIKSLLKEECNDSSPSNNQFFQVAMRYATPEESARVQDFNANYAFARVILTTILLISSILFYKYFDNYKTYAVLFPMILVAWYRAKQRGYYFAKEVLTTYLKMRKKDI